MDGALSVVPIRTPLGNVVGTLNVDTLCEEDPPEGASGDPTIEPHEQNFHQVCVYVCTNINANIFQSIYMYF